MSVSDARRPSPALLVAVIALVAALAGSAVALPGKNQVDKNDIKKGAVTKKALKKGAVTKKAIKAGAVTEAKLGDGAVTAAKIGPHEAAHQVGAPGEPAFGTGGQGDCDWHNAGATEGVSGEAPVGFYKDQLGQVHLQGIAIAEDGSGGDASCITSPTQIDDGVAFTLPAGYTPAALQFFASVGGDLVLIVPASGAKFSNVDLPPGTVWAEDGVALLDGVEFEPAASAPLKGKPVDIDLPELRRLAR